jgi:hypothetical protein
MQMWGKVLCHLIFTIRAVVERVHRSRIDFLGGLVASVASLRMGVLGDFAGRPLLGLACALDSVALNLGPACGERVKVLVRRGWDGTGQGRDLFPRELTIIANNDLLLGPLTLGLTVGEVVNCGILWAYIYLVGVCIAPIRLIHLGWLNILCPDLTGRTRQWSGGSKGWGRHSGLRGYGRQGWDGCSQRWGTNHIISNLAH